MHIQQVLARELPGGLNIIFLPMSNEAEGIETVRIGGLFQAVDVALKFDEIRAAIVFFATIKFVDNKFNLIELFGTCIDEFLFQAF